MNKEEKDWCIALDDVGWYDNSLFGKLPIFLKGERATKEKVFFEIPDITEEEYAKYFRPATEKEINGEFEWNGEQFVLKGSKRMKSINEFATEYAQDEYLPVQTSQAVKAGANYVINEIMDCFPHALCMNPNEVISNIVTTINELRK